MSALRKPTRKPWDQLEEIIERFEEAWRGGRRPDLEEYLATDGVDRRSLVIELAHADLECRLKAGEAARVEGYLQRFPELAAEREAVLGLIAAEHRLRLRREPSLSPEEFQQRFPEYGAELTERLRATPRPAGPLLEGTACPRCRHTMVADNNGDGSRLSCPSCGSSFRWDPGHQPAVLGGGPARLGRFELLAEVGRGAFGTVWRARDPELDRVVALKVPRGNRWVTPADEERFVREARHAARLAHPGIVPIHEAGRADDVPYIISAFVEGQTLAEALESRRFSFRESATLARDVAAALDHAHRQGVVHRDLKPSNVMLGRLVGMPAEDENAPRPFVMDFGLARREGGEATVTQEGQVLGTPAYMSPEQARGEARHVDGRSDVYSLGVILYEMLTGELPFRGVSRMVLQQILTDEPRPPRRLNDKIPRDLETVALKCLAKEPGRRYASAGELAADLGRYLAGEPIHARPVGRLEQGWRWARRNPRVAGLSAAVVVLLATLAIGSTASALIISGQRDAERSARADAESAQKQAEQSQGRAENEAAFAGRQRDVTLETLNGLVFEVQEQLRDRPGMGKLRESLLHRAVAGLERYARDGKGRPADSSMASAHERLGDLYLELGRTADARQEYEEFEAQARQLAGTDPENKQKRHSLWAACGKLGALCLREGDLATAGECYREALGLAEGLAPRDQAISHNHLGDVSLRRGEVRVAGEHFEKALKITEQSAGAGPRSPEARDDLAYVRGKLGDVALSLNHLADARNHYRAALEEREGLFAAAAESAKTRRNLAEALEKLGGLEHRQRDFATAEKLQRRCRDLRAELSQADPDNAMARRDWAVSLQKLGDLAYDRGDCLAARPLYEEALGQKRRLASADRDSVGAKQDLTTALERLGDVCHRLGDGRAALGHYLQALDVRKELAADPGDVAAQTNLASAYGSLGLAGMQARDYAKAAEYFSAGIAVLEELDAAGKLKEQPEARRRLQSQRSKQTACRNALLAINRPDVPLPANPLQAAQLLHVRAMALADRGQHAAAAETAERVRAMVPNNPLALYDVARCYAVCAAAALGDKSPAALAPEEAAARSRYVQQALQNLAEAVRRGFQDGTLLEADPDLTALRGEAEFRKLVENLKAQGPTR